MKKVAFLFEGSALKFIINYFQMFEIPSNKKIIKEGETDLIAGIRTKFNERAFQGNVQYLCDNTEIHLLQNYQEIKKDDYDKIYEFVSYQRDINYQNLNTEKYEKIFINIGERTTTKDKIDSELNGNKLISGANCDYVNSFYDYKLNLLYFYYYYGFNYLRYKYRKVEKQNMLGTYWFPNYKKERDEQVKKIKKQISFPIDFYSETNDLNTYECIRIMERDNWDRNHISSWTDYETSVVGYVFETLHHTVEYNSYNRLEYLGEKTLKPLLFSFLKMPFILDCNPYSFISLMKDGYWFLNSEFFDFSDNDSVEVLTKKFSESLKKSISLLEKMYIDNSGNLEKISDILYNEYKNKIDNNFLKINEDINYPKNGEELLKFILK